MKFRIFAVLLVTLAAGGTVPDLPVPGGVGEVQAAPRKRAPARKARPARKAKRANVSATLAALPDDPATPLRDAWARRMEAWLKAHRPTHGAFVALDPATGEVLLSSEYAAPGARFPRPATQAAFPAASIFKMVTSAALLEQTPVGPGTVTCYHGGSSWLDPSHLADTKRDRRCRDLTGAFAHSTNAVFGKLAVKHLDADALLRQAEALGFNHDLQVGDLKTRPTARKAKGDLDLARMAAGFVNASLSPLAGAVMAAIVANGGVRPPGLVVDGVASAGERVLKPETVERLRGMMTATSAGGTGTRYFSGLPARSGGGRVAVKSGTLNSRDGSGLHNTWMVGFFPAAKPEVAFAALVSTAGVGPVKAGHLARFALESYVTLKRNRRPSS